MMCLTCCGMWVEDTRDQTNKFIQKTKHGKKEVLLLKLKDMVVPV